MWNWSHCFNFYARKVCTLPFMYPQMQQGLAVKRKKKMPSNTTRSRCYIYLRRGFAQLCGRYGERCNTDKW